MRILASFQSLFGKGQVPSRLPEPTTAPVSTAQDLLCRADAASHASQASKRLPTNALQTPSGRALPLNWAAARHLAESQFETSGFEVVTAPQARAQGSIVYLAQCHDLGHPTSQMLAAQSQPKILSALWQLQPRDLFVEGLDRDVDHAALAQQGLPDLRAMFNDYKPALALRPNQQLALVRHGAAAAYAACHPDCTLRATTTPEIQQHSVTAIAYQTLPSGAVNRIREAHLMQVLHKSCAEHPSEPRVVIWGASHDLRPHLSGAGMQPDFLWLNTSGLSMADVRTVQAYFVEQNSF